MLVHHLRRWTNIVPCLLERRVCLDIIWSQRADGVVNICGDAGSAAQSLWGWTQGQINQWFYEMFSAKYRFVAWGIGPNSALEWPNLLAMLERRFVWTSETVQSLGTSDTICWGFHSRRLPLHVVLKCFELSQLWFHQWLCGHEGQDSLRCVQPIIIRPLWYERMYLPLWDVADTPFWLHMAVRYEKLCLFHL